MRVTLGKIRIWSDVELNVDRSEVEGALRAHERGDAGLASWSDRMQNFSWLVRKVGFTSKHRDQSGNEFWIITDYETEEPETHVVLRTW